MRKFFICLAAVLAFFSLGASPGQAARAASGQPSAETPASAVDKPRPIRVALVTGGPYGEYQEIFQGMIKGLEEQGAISNGNVPKPPDSEDMEPMWLWLSKNAGGSRVVFPADAYYSANWHQEQRGLNKKNLLERVKTRGDIDFILAFGTWGGQDASTDEFNIPVLVMSATDPVEAGIILSPEDSGRDNLMAVFNPGFATAQVRIFHEIFHFNKLGIVYEDTTSGRGAVSLSKIEKEAGRLGVELLRCTNEFDIEDLDLAAQRLLACHEKLVSEGAEAIYITYNMGMVPGKIPAVLAPVRKAAIPTFSQSGPAEVARGVLLSISHANLQAEGRFGAEAFNAIIKGAKPRSLSQVFSGVISLSMNLRMATLIGWNPPLEILVAVDEIYQSF
jgi:ABC-type uncharacterized transport system substrate-binding protein